MRSLADRGCVERGRYMWHEGDDYVRFLAEFFLRRSNRSTVQRFLPGFVEALPTFEALAATAPSDVVDLAWWAGLRQRVAKLPQIATEFVARDVWTARELLELPHVGTYAAEGIALYVFGEPTFPIDNNVRRVVGRYLGISTEEELGEAVQQLTQAAMRVGGIQHLKDVHRGTLSLGWEPCATKPRCESCPLADRCVSHPKAVHGYRPLK